MGLAVHFAVHLNSAVFKYLYIKRSYTIYISYNIYLIIYSHTSTDVLR